MKKYGKKLVSMILSLVMMIGVIFGVGSIKSSAICCCKDSFDKSRYKLTGDMAHDVAMIAKSQKGRTCNDFGYSGVDYGAWCDEFVADCIENAGGDSSIVAHGGTVADFESKMRERGAEPVTNPKEGDLIFFTISHVEIVTKVENGVVYSAGGNNGSYPGYCKGERSTSWGTARLYLRPNYTTSHTHSYNNITSSPAYCDAQGFTRYTCSCGYSYTEYTPALGHDYSVRSYYESAHPHYAVYKCSRCEKTTVNYSEVSPNEECLTCPPVSAIDLVVTPGTSSTETVITWNPRPSLVSSYSDYYKFLLCIYDSNGKIVKMKEEPCKLTNIRPNVSFVLPSGYYTAELDTVKNNDYANAVSISTTFYVAQGETKYTLTYNANGGSGVPSSQTGSASYTVTSTKPTRNGYTFLGWSKSGNASYASYTAGDTITLTSDTTLYAVWQKNVTYYSCRYCGHSFTSESECNSHQLECNSKPTIAVPDVEYSYCPICGEKFENEIECDEHAVTCGQKTCINCGEIFANETEYNAHLADCGAQNGDDNSSTGIFGLIISFFANIFSIIIMVITLPFTLFF